MQTLIKLKVLLSMPLISLNSQIQISVNPFTIELDFSIQIQYFVESVPLLLELMLQTFWEKKLSYNILSTQRHQMKSKFLFIFKIIRELFEHTHCLLNLFINYLTDIDSLFKSIVNILKSQNVLDPKSGLILRKLSLQMHQQFVNGTQTEQSLGIIQTSKVMTQENSATMTFTQLLSQHAKTTPDSLGKMLWKQWFYSTKSEEDFVRYSVSKLTKLITWFMERLLLQQSTVPCLVPLLYRSNMLLEWWLPITSHGGLSELESNLVIAKVQVPL